MLLTSINDNIAVINNIGNQEIDETTQYIIIFMIIKGSHFLVFVVIHLKIYSYISI